MEFLPYFALVFAAFTLLWVEHRPYREARRRRRELLERHPELKKHLK